MPIFEYSCRRCRHGFETIVLSTRERIICPCCGSSTVDKQVSVFRAGASSKETDSPTMGGGCACTPQTCGCR